jgi:hypothetical protein
MVVALCGALSFWGTHAPSAAVVRALLQEFGELDSRRAVVDSPADYIQRLSHYAGLQNTQWDSEAGPATHWAFIYNRYTAKAAPAEPLAFSELYLDEGFASPTREIFKLFEYLPGVGDSSRVVLYGLVTATGREEGL